MAELAEAAEYEPVAIERAAVVGCGVIGAAWASRMPVSYTHLTLPTKA